VCSSFGFDRRAGWYTTRFGWFAGVFVLVGVLGTLLIVRRVSTFEVLRILPVLVHIMVQSNVHLSIVVHGGC
jgi:hypothetical protein